MSARNTASLVLALVLPVLLGGCLVSGPAAGLYAVAEVASRAPMGVDIRERGNTTGLAEAVGCVDERLGRLDAAGALERFPAHATLVRMKLDFLRDGAGTPTLAEAERSLDNIRSRLTEMEYWAESDAGTTPEMMAAIAQARSSCPIATNVASRR